MNRAQHMLLPALYKVICFCAAVEAHHLHSTTAEAQLWVKVSAHTHTHTSQLQGVVGMQRSVQPACGSCMLLPSCCCNLALIFGQLTLPGGMGGSLCSRMAATIACRSQHRSVSAQVKYQHTRREHAVLCCASSCACTACN